MQKLKTFRVLWQYGYNHALHTLLAIILFFFVLDRVLVVWFSSPIINRYLSLSVWELKSGYFWQLISYILLHESIWHVFLNTLMLFFIGRWIESHHGGKQLWSTFLVSSMLGGIVWFWVNRGQLHHTLIGSSAGCLGLFSYFCLMCENRPAIFLFFFILPVRLKPRTLLAIAVVLEFLGFLTNESVGGNIANSAHLGGILGGCVVYLWNHYRKDYELLKKNCVFRRKETPSTHHVIHGGSYKVYCGSNSAQRDEINRILDKINKSGFGSLTKTERDTLDSVKHRLNR